MNLYLISQEVNKEYDTYDAAVVAAESEAEARAIHPSGETDPEWIECYSHTWCDVEDVKARLIGIAAPGVARGVVCASFNAG